MKKHPSFLKELESLAKQMKFYGNDPDAVKSPKGEPLTPDQLLNILVMMGDVRDIPIMLTLGADPRKVYKKALAFKHDPVIALLEAHGAKKQRRIKPTRS